MEPRAGGSVNNNQRSGTTKKVSKKSPLKLVRVSHYPTFDAVIARTLGKKYPRTLHGVQFTYEKPVTAQQVKARLRAAGIRSCQVEVFDP